MLKLNPHEIVSTLIVAALVPAIVVLMCIDDSSPQAREESIHDIITFVRGHD
jgi:hypothetical protein